MSYTKQQRHYNKVIKPVLMELEKTAKKAAGYKQKTVRINVKRMKADDIVRLIIKELLEG